MLCGVKMFDSQPHHSFKMHNFIFDDMRYKKKVWHFEAQVRLRMEMLRTFYFRL